MNVIIVSLSSLNLRLLRVEIIDLRQDTFFFSIRNLKAPSRNITIVVEKRRIGLTKLRNLGRFLAKFVEESEKFRRLGFFFFWG